MSHFSLLTLCLFLVPSVLMAEYRSTSDKVYSPDYMSHKHIIKVHDKNKDLEIALSSPSAGQKLNTEMQRSIILIESKEQLSDLPDPLVKKIESITKKKGLKAFYIFANFLHSSALNPNKSDHYIAILPKNTIFKETLFELTYNSQNVIVGSQIRMIFNKKMTLIPQQSETYPVLSLQKGDITYALSRVSKEGASNNLNPLESLTGGYAYALQFISQSFLKKSEVSKNLRKESHSLTGLTNTQRKAIFDKALNASHSLQEEGIYNLAYNNETTHMLEALSAGIPHLNKKLINPYQIVNQLGLALGGKIKQKTSYENSFNLFENISALEHKTPITNPQFNAQEIYETLNKVSLIILKKKSIYAKIIESFNNESKRTPTDANKSSKGLGLFKSLFSGEVSDKKIDDLIGFLSLLQK